MANPVVHFEIIGSNPESLRSYYSELFGWEFDTSGEVSDAVSDPDDYGFMTKRTTPDGTGIPGGVGGGAEYAPQAVFYVGVESVARALADAERLGGTKIFGPVTSPNGLVVAQFTDPQGSTIGLAGG